MSFQDERHPRELLSAWLDGELGASDGARVEVHLGGCAECRSLLADLRTLSRAVGEEETPQTSAGLAARISDRVRTEGVVGAMRRPTPPRRYAIPWSLAGSLAAAGILVVIVLKAGLELPGLQEPRQLNEVVVTAPDQKPPEEAKPPTDRHEEVAAAKAERKDLPAKRGPGALSAPEVSRLKTRGYVGSGDANLEKPRADRTRGEPEGLEDSNLKRDLPPSAAAPPPPPAAESEAASPGAHNRLSESATDHRVNTAQAPAETSLLHGRTKTTAYAPCPAAWEVRADEPPVAVFLGLGTDESIAAHAARLPGRWERLTTGTASTFRFEIERARWPELREALARLGARNLPAGDAPPAAVDCVRLTVVFETVAE